MYVWKLEKSLCAINEALCVNMPTNHLVQFIQQCINHSKLYTALVITLFTLTQTLFPTLVPVVLTCYIISNHFCCPLLAVFLISTT